MKFFNLFSKKEDYLGNCLTSIQTKIIKNDEFRNLNRRSENYQNELNEFKKFIAIFISGCLFILKAKEYLKIDDFKGNDPIYKKIFQTIYWQLIPFYKLYVQNDKIIIGLFDNSRMKNDNMLSVDIMARLGKYQEEIREGLKHGNPYFFEKYDTDEYDEEFSIQITGEKLYFEHIRLLFLSKLEKGDDNNKLYIKQFEIWEIDDFEFNNLSSFVKYLAEIYNDIKITPEMLS